MAQSQAERFEALILPHLDAAYTLARYVLRDEHDAQDAVQDASLRAFRHFEGFKGGDSRAWFLVIVRNCCFSSRRRHQTDRMTIPFTDDHLTIVRDGTEADAEAIAQSDRAAIERAIAALPVEFREVIVLRELEGLSYAQIGEIVGAPIGTVMSRLSRGRKRLASVLGMDSQEAS